jgi:hypothetical protein
MDKPQPAPSTAAAAATASRVLSLFKSKEDPAVRRRRQEIRAICKEQERLEKKEIVQTWKIGFGNEIPKQKKHIYRIENITQRNIWMEPYFLYNTIKSFMPDQIFHPPEYYALKWQPPGSSFRLLINMNDPIIQESALLLISKMSILQRRRVFFLFAPVNPTLPLYAPKVHPASLVSYRTKNEVLKKLSEIFLQGKIMITDINQIFSCGDDVWKSALYNVLPHDEQIYHEYLMELPPVVLTDKEIAKAYISSQISLSEYDDLKFPDRKRMKDIMSQKYPLPYNYETCVICQTENKGIVRCQNCNNKVCVSCLNSVFHSVEKPISFLLMHDQYCLKLGHLDDVNLIVAPESGYLREFRMMSRAVAIDFFTPKKAAVVVQTEMYEEETEEERLASEMERAVKAAERARRLEMENPAALKELVEEFKPYFKKFTRMKKDILEYSDKAGDASHTEQFIARNIRLRNKVMLKLLKKVKQPMEDMLQRARSLNITSGQYIKEFLASIEPVVKTIHDYESFFPPTTEQEEADVIAAVDDDSLT